MKALEIIKQWDNMEFGDSLDQHKRKIDKAIKELEELNNRSCSKCNNNIFNKGKKEYGCNRIEINPSDMKQAGFYCSKYEAKGE